MSDSSPTDSKRDSTHADPANPRTIVLTGVSRGLGRAMLEHFAERGHTVWGCARDPHVVAELREQFSDPHRLEVVDVARPEQVEGWAASCTGPVDLLVNNAAIINRNACLWQVSPGEFARLTEININGTFHVIRSFVPRMIAEKRGVIVNFSSGWGRSTSPEVTPYCATKWAIEGLSRGLSQELPRGMASVAFNPGVIATDMLQSCFGGSAAAFPSPEQWALRAVPFLLSLSSDDNGRSLDVPT